MSGSQDQTTTFAPLDDDRERMSAYAHLRVFESDYDRSQAQLRTAASTWTVSAIGALALLASKITGAGIGSWSVATASSTACALAILGLLLLWIMDQGVYQRLLHTVFAYGLSVEAANNDLPQVRTALFKANSNISPLLGLYYGAPIMVFWAVSLLYLIQRCRLGTALLFLACSAMVAVFILYSWWLTQQLERLVRLFGPAVTEHLGLPAGQTPPRLPRFIGIWLAKPAVAPAGLPAPPVGEALAERLGTIMQWVGNNIFSAMEPFQAADSSCATLRLRGKPLPKKPKAASATPG